MSSARASWGISFRSPKDTFKDNKKFIEKKLNEVIQEIRRMCKIHQENFNNIFELVIPLENYKKHFINTYTIEILLSKNHVPWVNEKFEKFNELSFKIKKFIKILQMEKAEGWTFQSFENLLKNLPEEALNLKKDILSSFDTFFHKEINQAIENEDIKRQIEILESIPSSLSQYKDIATEMIHNSIKNKIKSCQENHHIQELSKLYDLLQKQFKSYQQNILEAVDEIIAKKIEETRYTNKFDELEKFYYEIPEKFSKAKNKVANELLRNQFQIKKIQEEESKTKEEQEKIQNLKEEAQKFYEKITKINKNQAEKLKELIEELQESHDSSRIFYINKEMKITYTRTKHIYVESEILKEDIRNQYQNINLPEIRQEIQEFLNKEVVTQEEYDALINKINYREIENEQKKAEEEGKKKILSLIEENLKKLGYTTINESAAEKLYKGEIIEIQTPFGEDYTVRLKFDGNMIAVRFIRYVEDESNLSTYEKEKDILIAKEWCKTYDHILELIKQNGILLEEKHRIEPEQKFYYEKKENQQKRMQQIKKQDILRKDI